MLTASEAMAAAGSLRGEAEQEWTRLAIFTRYARGQQRMPWLPENTDGEYHDIARKSASNWLSLVIAAVAQGLIVDGYDSELAWRDAWQANQMDSRQHSLHRATLVHGYAFEIVLPSEDGGVWMRPEAATRMHATYSLPDDEWPQYAVRMLRRNPDVLEVYDAEARYTIAGSDVTVFEHGLGVCPVVRVMNQLDLLGTPMGEVEPVIPIQNRIVDATFNLQMVAKYGSFPQRFIAGMDPAANSERIRAYVDSILIAGDPDTKFGQFAPADLTQFVTALEAHIRHLAAITQTPPHYLLGHMSNMSAEALAAAESGLQRKIRERQETIGEGHEQALRLAAAILGDEQAAASIDSQVHWQDVESRSLAQTSDALLKLGQLGVPAEMLFRMIPGWSQADVLEATDMLRSGSGLSALMSALQLAAPDPTQMPMTPGA